MASQAENLKVFKTCKKNNLYLVLDKMKCLDDNLVKILCRIFDVSIADISEVCHPSDAESKVAIRVALRGLSVPKAVAVYLNSEFYTIPPELQDRSVHLQSMEYAFIDEADSAVYLSAEKSQISQFVEGLEPHSRNIKYVMQNPDIRITMRALPFDQARSNFELARAEPMF